MLRAYSSSWNGEESRLPPLDREEAHHLARVRRARVGEAIEVLNGRGHVGKARVASLDGRDIRLELESVATVEPRPLQPHLLVALPKGKTFPGLLQKAVELGVAEITPLLTENVETPPCRAGSKRDHWQAVLVEALKQSGNPWLPVLHPPTALAAALAGPPAGCRLCAALQPDARPLWSLLGNPVQPVGRVEVFIGPEGDFSAAEYAELRAAGCHFITLGPLVLKVETAASLVAGTLHLWANSFQQDRP